MACSVRIMSLKSVRPKASHPSCSDVPALFEWPFKTAGLTFDELHVNRVSKSESKILFAGKQRLHLRQIGVQSHAERSPWIKSRAPQLQKFDADMMKRNIDHSSITTSEAKEAEIINREKSKKKTYQFGVASAEVLTEGALNCTALFQSNSQSEIDTKLHSKSFAENELSSSRRASSKHAKTGADTNTSKSTHSHETAYYEYGLPSYWAKSSKIQSNVAFHAKYPGVLYPDSARAQAVTYPSSVVQVRSSHSSAHWTASQCRDSPQNVSSSRKHRVWTEEKSGGREQAKRSEQQKYDGDVFKEKKSVCISTLRERKSPALHASERSETSERKYSETSSSGNITRSTDESEDWNTEGFIRKLDMLPRRWEKTWLGKNQKRFSKASKSKKLKTQDVEFTIMTYNILSQDLLANHCALYTSCSPSAVDWNLRGQRLVAEISYHKPDIINLQEVQSDHFKDYLFPEFEKLGYAGVYEKRKGDKCDGCATLWQTRKFQLLRSTPVDYCRGGLLDRNNIALLVELQPRRKLSTQGQQNREDKLLVANTHILFNPRRGDIKLAQLMVLLAEVDKHAFLGLKEAQPDSLQNSADSQNEPNHAGVSALYCPVIITGDFNMEPYCQLYKLLVAGHLQYQGQLIRTMSGQEEGQYGNNRTLEQSFFSPDYGISDRCQYAVLEQQRTVHHPGFHSTHTFTARGRCGESSSILSDSSSDSWSFSLDESINSPNCTLSSQSSLDVKAATLPGNSGSLTHSLNLVSAYRHTIERLGNWEEEITTHHDKARCTVDYIFYSVATKMVENQHGNRVKLRQVKEGCLKLLARYGLMSAQELERLGSLPNTTLASDHLCLIAKFLLT